ncbi:uncharacterized protein LOC123298339 isoform X2 [Chrysoperla carnea]|uniref:uncharacterized protein LOC123298339 isoform X2 n=1 Tax=Chrysoperla carnea TaxID=189513 RepID=UPI001D0981C7|nr:uncharacterized protein LOC123298339 isoform X2 [Chrysoperla carnea]
MAITREYASLFLSSRVQELNGNIDVEECICIIAEEEDKQKEREELVNEDEEQKEQQWSRLGPMGIHLEPKIFPAYESRPVNRNEASLRNQPNQFLKKLEEKYPYLFGVLQKEPPNDLIARVNRERLRTTYMVDFSKTDSIPSDSYGELLTAARLEGISPCPPPVRLPGDKHPPNIRSRAFRSSSDVTQQPPMKREDTGFREEVFILGKSEYQDNISKLGGIIIREKLLSRVP